MSALEALALCALGGQLLCAALVIWNHRHTPDLAAEPPAGPGAPRVLALVPARNEAANIGACVAALGASRYPRLRVRVVDDGSSDDTAILARAAGAEVVPAGELPPGWLGKNHALWVGVRGADEDYLLFVDADVRVRPDCVGRLVGAAERQGADLLSIMPRIEARTFWERAAQALIAQLVYAWLPARDINDPRRRAAAAMGPLMLFRRTAYRRVGGHAGVRGEVVEDLRLAEAVKRAGGRLVYGRGVALASLRMYASLGAIVRGWSKNFHVALSGVRLLGAVLGAGVLVVHAGPVLLPLAALGTEQPRALGVALAALGVAVLAQLDAGRRYGLLCRGTPERALGAFVVAFILARAALGGPVSWKGRAVPAGAPRPGRGPRGSGARWRSWGISTPCRAARQLHQDTTTDADAQEIGPWGSDTTSQGR